MTVAEQQDASRSTTCASASLPPTLRAASKPLTPSRTRHVSEAEFVAHAAAHGLSFSPAVHPHAPSDFRCPTHFAKRVHGADVARLTGPQKQVLVDALYRFGLIHLADQAHLTPADEVAFATLW